MPNEPPPIGHAGAPVRALAFSSGAFETAMQLGVTHALLVIQGRLPDAVVGVSAGAVNAVALAEILRAGCKDQAAPPSPSPDDRALQARRYALLEARVKRFREIFDAYQRAPSELAQALLPDTFQLEATRPLEAIQLPIHHEKERDARQAAVQARAGLINLYNHLLDLRLSVGTLTRAVRRYLGIQASAEMRPASKHYAAVFVEGARSWLLVGFNLFRLAPLLRLLLPPVLRRAPKEEGGATAAALIFRSRLWEAVERVTGDGFSFLVLGTLWIGLTLAPGLILWELGQLLGRLASARIPPWWTFMLGVYAAGALAALLVAALGRDVRESLRQTLAELVGFAALVASGVAAIWLPVLGLTVAPHWSGWPHLGATLLEQCGPAWAVTVDVLAVVVAWSLMAVAVLVLRFPRRKYLRRLLGQYDLADSLFSENPLRQLIVDILDPRYYGSNRMDDVVERALQDDPSPATTPIAGRLVGDYARGPDGTRIHVGLGVADVASGKLKVADDGTRVVNGLLAATAITPLLRPQRIDGELFVDGANISGRATHLLLDFIRDRVHPGATVVHVYTVASLPFTRGALGGPKRAYLTLVDVVVRALQLQRFRDASLERRLTELYSEVMPSQAGARFRSGTGEDYLRAWVSPIEPEAPLSLERDLLAARDAQARRDIIARTVADGCRASLEVMIRPSLGPGPAPPQDARVMACRQAVKAHLERRVAAAGGQLLVPELPGSTPSNPSIPSSARAGPGLPEVCQHCVLQSAGSGERDPLAGQSIRVHAWRRMGPAWPYELEPDSAPAAEDPHFVHGPAEYEVQSEEALSAFADAMTRPGYPAEERWPRPSPIGAGTSRPTVSFLFSGGVFRGVYQMGVLSGLSEAGLQPDIIAGASVGSITAALVAESFGHNRGAPRDARIARLAATYLALDRLILTDRFADLVRSFTLRAAATRFSLQQADRFFRRYDAAGAGRFDREARSVVAGLERLLYISPFELASLVKAIRLQDMPEMTRLLKDYLQEWLDRMGCGSQVLGAEPLALIITEHVLPWLAAGTAPDAPVPFDAFLKHRGIYFLATTTNLTEGRLEVLGEQQLFGSRRVVLLEGLLASSAFPGVFRPRWSWEVRPATPEADQYIDGGVMDNLPLDAVAKFLFHAGKAGLIEPRPGVPHLIFSASLEVSPAALTPAQVEALEADWPALWKRAGVLRYNKKLEAYAEAQRAIRDIWTTPGVARPDAPFVPLDLEIATVIPRWLCGTFAFHPMLGFRRARQAESIAHGCASTLVALGRLALAQPAWAAGWGIDPSEVPDAKLLNRPDPLEPVPAPPGRCWLRPNTPCPFSRERLAKTGLARGTLAGLERIHLACTRAETHRARDGAP